MAAIITHGEIFPFFFFKLSWLENVFENTPSWLIPGTYIKKQHISSFTSTLLTNNEVFWTPPEGSFFSGGKQYNIGPIWVKKLSDVINPF